MQEMASQCEGVVRVRVGSTMAQRRSVVHPGKLSAQQTFLPSEELEVAIV